MVCIKAIFYTKPEASDPPQAYFPPYITGVAPGLHPNNLDRKGDSHFH